MSDSSIEISVRYTAGAHVTCTRRGVRASSTGSARTAAEAFGAKYFGPAFKLVQPLDAAGRTWMVVGDPKWYAWCWADGVIDIGPDMPTAEGAALFASGPERALKHVLGVVARHGKGAGTGKLLVPGVPEASGQKAGMDALIAWVKWCAVRNGTNASFGVVFSNRGDAL